MPRQILSLVYWNSGNLLVVPASAEAAITPAIDPKLSYKDLEGVQVGSHAGIAYLEACNPETRLERREELRKQMLEYCKLDTFATVRIWEVF